MQWVMIGFKILPYVFAAVQAVERFVSGKGAQKEDAAVGMVHAILQTIEVGADKDLLNDADVNRATREVMQAVVALQNVIARKRAAQPVA